MALASVAELVGASSNKLKGPGSIPIRAHTWVVVQSQSGRAGGNQSMFLSHSNVSFPLSLSPFPSL